MQNELDHALAALRRIGDSIADAAPTFLKGVAVLVAVWLAAKLVRGIVHRALRAVRIDKAIEQTRIQGLLRAFGKDLTASEGIAKLVYFGMLLLAWNTAAGIWGLVALVDAIGAVLGYLPRVGSALVAFAVGTYLASLAKRAVGGFLREMRNPAAHLLESVTEGVILLVVALIAADMLGADLSFVTANLTLFVGALLIITVFLSCWAMRRPAEELIANYYLRRMLSVGDVVENGGIKGTVHRFVPLGLMLRDTTGVERFVPAKSMLTGLTRRPGVQPEQPAP